MTAGFSVRPELALVISVYHCAGRLEPTVGKLDAFMRDAPMACELVLVDDCGTDPRAAALARRFAERPGVRLVRNDRNRGKGYSVRRGMIEAAGRWRVFTDADLAYPLAEVWNIVGRLRDGADVAIANRVLGASEYVLSASFLRYLYTRHLMSRAFNRLVRLTLLPGISDTQAGLKGYSARAADAVFPLVHIAGFGFDLECLYVARQLGFQVEQVPVKFRYDDEPSTVRLLHDAATMTADLARIRWRGLNGQYRLQAPIREASAGGPLRESVRKPLRARSEAFISRV